MIQRLKTLQAKKAQYPNGRVLMQSLKTDLVLRKEIETLSKQFLDKTVKGCSNCYYDAYLELISLSVDKIMNKQQCRFEIRRGVLLRDVVNLDISKNMTQANITDELALYHLKTNPKCAEKFSRLPENWKELVETDQEVKELNEVTEVKKPAQRKQKQSKDFL